MTEEQEFKELNRQYEEKFGEPIARMMIQTASYATMIKNIKKCLKTGKPYPYPKYPDDALI